ncbi:hypothetical protein [Tsukamurella pulmonis]|nr:hypothetical protein [Tsukamurella pulmonis]
MSGRSLNELLELLVQGRDFGVQVADSACEGPQGQLRRVGRL